MPCTVPKIALTAAMPATPALASGRAAEHDAAEAAIRDEQQQDHAYRRSRAERLRLPARARLHQHRELACAADGQVMCRSPRDLRQRVLELAECEPLAVGVERGRLRDREQQRALAAAIEPHVELAMRLLHRLPALQQLQQLERRIARQPLLEERAGGRGQVACARLQLAVQVLLIERLRVESGREQEAVRQQLVGNGVQRHLAVGDDAEAAALPQRVDERARNVREHSARLRLPARRPARARQDLRRSPPAAALLAE